MSSQGIFLFDLNALQEIDLCSEETLSKITCVFRNVFLRLFAEFTRESPNFRFGVKFFSSRGGLNREKNKHTLSDISVESFQSLYKTILDRYSKCADSAKNVPAERSSSRIASRNPVVPPVGFMSNALKEILCDYEWNTPEICSPVRKENAALERNFVFMFAPCPRDLQTFCGTEHSVTSSDLKNFLMPRALHEKFVNDACISLIWLDTVNISASGPLVHKDSIMVQKTIEHVMADLQGLLMPVEVLSHINVIHECCILSSYHQNHLLGHHEDDAGNKVPQFSAAEKSLWFPFLQMLSCYVVVTRHNRPSHNTCELIWPNSDTFELQLTPAFVNGIRQLKSSAFVNYLKSRFHCLAKAENQDDQWCKFDVCAIVDRTFYKPPHTEFFCEPATNISLKDCLTYTRVVKKLCCQNQYLVLRCESKKGNVALGLLSSFSTISGVLSIYTLSCLLRNDESCSTGTGTTKADKVTVDADGEKIRYLIEEVVNHSDGHNFLNIDHFKEMFGSFVAMPSQMGSIESWLATPSIVPKVYEDIDVASYMHNLHHSKKEVKHQSGIKFLHLSSSQSSTGLASPASSTRSSALSIGSAVSCKSSSSLVNQREYKWKKKSVNQSMFSDSFSKKQVSLPRGNDKPYNEQKVKGPLLSAGRSPRLAAIYQQTQNFSPRTKRARVRRNLFNTASKPLVQRKKVPALNNKLRRASPKSKVTLSPTNRNQKFKSASSKLPQPNRTHSKEESMQNKPNHPKPLNDVLSDSENLKSDFKGKEDLISAVKKMHDSAVKEDGSLLSAAHSIVKSVLLFFKSESVSLKEDLLAFLQNNLLVTSKSISELYDGKAGEMIDEKAKEYEIQALLILEVEAAFPSSPSTSAEACVEKVVSLLRGMLFSVGHGRVSQFLRDCVRENYCHNLQHILVDIEEELGVSILENSEDSSPSKIESPDHTESLKLIPTFPSTSGATSLEEPWPTKKTRLSHRTFSSDFQGRQIRVPNEILKKKKLKRKSKTEPAVPTRYSPRLDLRKKRILSCVQTPDPKRIRRNLFGCDIQAKPAQTTSSAKRPNKTTKKGILTPKGHHTLKTTYVPETPLHRQGRSCIRRRQDHLRKMSGTLCTDKEEVAESPINNGENVP